MILFWEVPLSIYSHQQFWFECKMSLEVHGLESWFPVCSMGQGVFPAFSKWITMEWRRQLRTGPLRIVLRADLVLGSLLDLLPCEEPWLYAYFLWVLECLPHCGGFSMTLSQNKSLFSEVVSGKYICHRDKKVANTWLHTYSCLTM